MYTREKGYEGEDYAEKYLKNLGYEIIKRNFTFGKTGEIDIIARDKKEVVFIEVKSRTSTAYGDLYDSVPESKRKSIRKAAEGYIYITNIEAVSYRFDFIGIDRTIKPWKIIHIKDAF